jgi:peptidoglycan/xylan/chitin deacetylase (PgdA/CDA1 family)
LETAVSTQDAQDAPDKVKLPVIMYHALLKHSSKDNQYVISPDLFEADLKYLQEAGYTPVFMADVIDYVENGVSLPDRPIVLTFDDGYYNNYYYADSFLEKYNMKAVLSVVGSLSQEFSDTPDENPNYAHVTWDHILQMHLSGRWEIQNHSYDCHTYTSRNGVSQMKGESYESYKDFLTGDLMKLQDKLEEVTGVIPNTFTYPFGAFSENTDKVLKSLGFKATFSCTEGISTIKKGDPDSLYKLKRYLRPPNVSSDKFFAFLD